MYRQVLYRHPVILRYHATTSLAAKHHTCAAALDRIKHLLAIPFQPAHRTGRIGVEMDGACSPCCAVSLSSFFKSDQGPAHSGRKWRQWCYFGTAVACTRRRWHVVILRYGSSQTWCPSNHSGCAVECEYNEGLQRHNLKPDIVCCSNRCMYATASQRGRKNENKCWPHAACMYRTARTPPRPSVPRHQEKVVALPP